MLNTKEATDAELVILKAVLYNAIDKAVHLWAQDGMEEDIRDLERRVNLERETRAVFSTFENRPMPTGVMFNKEEGLFEVGPFVFMVARLKKHYPEIPNEYLPELALFVADGVVDCYSSAEYWVRADEVDPAIVVGYNGQGCYDRQVAAQECGPYC